MIIEKMSQQLALPMGFVRGVARGASHEYKQYEIKKHNSTEYRTIYHPTPRLKSLQRWLLRNVIELLPVHNAAFAYRKGVSIWDNARLHARSNFLLRLDFRNFFGSISVHDINTYISDRPQTFNSWSSDDIRLLCDVVTKDGALTIGAPTSPALSNALCYDLDLMIDSYCRKEGVIYSRYADDLFFSTRRRDFLHSTESEISQICSRLKCPSNLQLNGSKIRHSSKRGARRVTGITLGSDEQTYVGRAVKRKIRAQIHQLESLDDKKRATLAGLLAYVVAYDPNFINNLVLKYGLDRVRRAQLVGTN